MTHPPVLAFLDFTQEFIIKCDVSGSGDGAVLMQGNRPIVFLNQALKSSNLSLSIYEKELLALVVAVKKWRSYLIGSTFVIRTDHYILKYMLE